MKAAHWTVIACCLSIAMLSCGRNSGSADNKGGGSGGNGSTRTGEEASVVIAAGLSGVFSSSDGMLGEGPATNEISSADVCPDYGANTANCSNAGDGVTNFGIQFSQCKRASTKGLWNGGMILSFAHGAVCGDTLPSKVLGSTVTRNFIAGTTISYEGGFSVVIDTITKKGYSNPVSGGSTVKVNAVTGELNVRSVKIDGVHVAALQGGAIVWDHSMNSDEAGLVVVGTGNDRQITAGTITVQHNIGKFVSTTRVIEPLTFKKSHGLETVCCHPTGGAMQTTYEGGKSIGKKETIKFGPKCGQANIKTIDEREVSLMLAHCL